MLLSSYSSRGEVLRLQMNSYCIDNPLTMTDRGLSSYLQECYVADLRSVPHRVPIGAHIARGSYGALFFIIWENLPDYGEMSFSSRAGIIEVAA